MPTPFNRVYFYTEVIWSTPERRPHRDTLWEPLQSTMQKNYQDTLFILCRAEKKKKKRKSYYRGVSDYVIVR